MIDLKILPSQENLIYETSKRELFPRHYTTRNTSIRCIEQKQTKFRSPRLGSQLIQVSQRQSAIQSQKQLKDLKNIMLNMKVKTITDIFIRKLRRNFHLKEVQPVKIKRIEHICKLKGIQFSERVQHFIIASFVISIIVLMILTSFESTLNQFSDKVQTSTGVITVKYVCLFIMILHCMIHSFGHRFKNGQYLQFATDILETYLKSSNAFIDLTTILLLILFMIYPKNRGLSILFFGFLILEFMRSVSELVNLEAAYIHSRKISMIWRLFKIVIFNLILAHIVATILLGMSYLDPNQSWIVKYGIEGAPWYVYYIISFYWGTIIVTTIGFGDISCGNWREAIVISIIVMFTSIILGFNLSQFNNIFSNLRASSQKVSQNKAIFKRMVIRDENNNATIDPSLKKQIYKFIDDEGLDKGDIQFAQRNQFISSLPQYLRKAYLRAANKKIFISVLFFNQLKHQTLALLCNSFSNYFLYPQEQILDPNNKINILEEGKVGFIYKREGSVLNGMIFDQMSVNKKQNLLLLNSDFLTIHKETNYGFYGKTCSIIWSIGIEEFVDILRTDFMDFQYYFSILHKHTLDEDEWQVKICTRCSHSKKAVRHSTFRCPQISYMPMRNFITYRYIKNPNIQTQPRNRYIRRRIDRNKVSVLKYYKNYFEALVNEKTKIQAEQNYLINLFPKRNPANIRNLQLISEQAEQKFYDKHTSSLIIDNPQNFDFYFPTYNPSKFAAYPLDKTALRIQTKISTMSKLHPSFA